MTDFVQFCQLHGIKISHLPPVGKWCRYPTEDHPSSRNGAVKYMGDVGFVQNHAAMLDVAVWRPDSEQRASIDHAAIARRAAEADRQVREGREKAARSAADIVSKCYQGAHPYLDRKGFPEERGLCLNDPDRGLLLAIPMRVNRTELVGLQMIDADGGKKFLFGQRTSDAVFVIGDRRRRPILCEGYATALSVRQAVAACKMLACVVVCFSAHNIPKIAARCNGQAVVVADNDRSGTGERVAVQSGMPWWMPPDVGTDANDYHQAAGIYELSRQIKLLLMSKPHV